VRLQPAEDGAEPERVGALTNDLCDLTLHDAADGRKLDSGTVAQVGGQVRLDPHGKRDVYLGSYYCAVYVSAG